MQYNKKAIWSSMQSSNISNLNPLKENVFWLVILPPIHKKPLVVVISIPVKRTAFSTARSPFLFAFYFILIGLLFLDIFQPTYLSLLLEQKGVYMCF